MTQGCYRKKEVPRPKNGSLPVVPPEMDGQGKDASGLGRDTYAAVTTDDEQTSRVTDTISLEVPSITSEGQDDCASNPAMPCRPAQRILP